MKNNFPTWADDTELLASLDARFAAVDESIRALRPQHSQRGFLRERDLLQNAVGQQQLQIDSIVARHIVASTITADKMNVTSLSAITANIGTITAGNITLDTAGFIRGGATAYNTGTGFWMGYDTSAYKFFIGTAAGNKILWDGTTLAITGVITATTGSIGGFDIGTDYIRDTANSMGLASTVTGGDDVRFWAGATFANRATAPFRLTEAGVMNATSGVIGGFTLSTTTLTAGSGNTYVNINSAGTIYLGVADGTHNSNYATANSVSIKGYSPNVWVDIGNGSVAGGTWTYSGSYSYSINWEILSTGASTFLGELKVNAAGSTQTKIDTTGNVLIGSAGVLKIGGTKVVGAQAAAEADLALDTSVPGIDTVDEASIEQNFIDLNTKINNILAKIRTHGLFAT